MTDIISYLSPTTTSISGLRLLKIIEASMSIPVDFAIVEGLSPSMILWKIKSGSNPSFLIKSSTFPNLSKIADAPKTT